MEGIVKVTEIESAGAFGYPAVKTDCEIACSLEYAELPHFQLIQSDHDDAPRKGKGTSLQKVNLVEGKLDQIALKEIRKRLADETIQKTPGGVETQTLVASLGSAKMQKLPPRYSHTSEKKYAQYAQKAVRTFLDYMDSGFPSPYNAGLRVQKTEQPQRAARQLPSHSLELGIGIVEQRFYNYKAACFVMVVGSSKATASTDADAADKSSSNN